MVVKSWPSKKLRITHIITAEPLVMYSDRFSTCTMLCALFYLARHTLSPKGVQPVSVSSASGQKDKKTFD